MDIQVILTNVKETMKQWFALKSEVPTKTSDLVNDLNFMSTLTDTGWQNIIFDDNFTNINNDKKVRYRRIGKIVHIEGIAKALIDIPLDTADIKIGTISDYYCRPNKNQYSTQYGTGYHTFKLNIEPSGNIYAYRYGITEQTQITAGTVLYCYMTWIVEEEKFMINTKLNIECNIENMNFYETDKKVTFTVTLTDENNNILTDKLISCYKDGQFLNQSSTDDNGQIILIDRDNNYYETDHEFKFVAHDSYGYNESKKYYYVYGVHTIDDNM
jgi:hypothetical protein